MYVSIRSTVLILIVCLSVCSSVHSAVVWSDEFDGPYIDTNTWTWDVAGWGFGNGQFEYDTARSKNSYIEDGSLVIEAIREDYFGNSFTSARLLTQGRFAFKYGTLEARIKFPDTENGLWPAFWLLGNNFPGIPWPQSGEVDIVEMGSAAGIAEGLQQEKINCAIHYSLADDSYAYNSAWTDASVDLSLDYHLYKVEWTPAYLKFYLDGIEYGSWDITPDYLTEFHQPAFPILNLAIGGWDPSYTGVYSPAGVTALPTAGSMAKMYVDWIRLEDNAFTEVYLGADTEEVDNFGVFTETTPVNNSLVYEDGSDPAFEYGTAAALYTWNNMTESATPATPSEGTEVWTFDISAGQWFGMGVFLPNFRNMKNYSDGFLHFDMQTTLTDTIKIGLKSSRGGEFWLPVGDETSEIGFARDGNWHTVSIPLNRYANTDFNTIHQIFMIAADSASASTTLSIDNVYWEPSAARPTPANGNFGVYTETAANKDAGEFALGVDGNFFVWENTLDPAAQTPYEGSESLSFTSAAGLSWFGAAFTPNIKYNLTAFSYPESKLRFAMKTSSSTTFMIGMKSGNVIGPDSPWGSNTGPAGVGQVWITFAPGSDPYGFVRDGNWHVIEIPMSDIIADIDLFAVSQLFQILGITGPISDIELDDIYFTGGGDPLIPDGGDSNIPPSVSITSPVDGTFYAPGDDILIEADASDGDGDGTVIKVEFFEGITLLGEDLTDPYSFPFNDVSEGTYIFRAKATDPNGATSTSSPVTVYVGTPELTSINVSPSSVSTEEWTATQFTASGLDQFGQTIAADVSWSVSDGGIIDENGLFTAIDIGGPYIVTAEDGAISGTANVDIYGGGLCSGPSGNDDYTWEASGASSNPTITFIPARAGVGSSLVILYYGRNPGAVMPGYITTPNTPFQITASEGETIYFYYTYSVPEGGEHTTVNNKHSFVVGDCESTAATDCDGNGSVNFVDFACLAGEWMATDCDAGNAYCDGSDYAEDGDVDMYDLLVFVHSWLMGS